MGVFHPAAIMKRPPGERIPTHEDLKIRFQVWGGSRCSVLLVEQMVIPFQTGQRSEEGGKLDENKLFLPSPVALGDFGNELPTGRQWSGTYCSYHRSDSHNTSECKSVKGVIRQMIDSGELGKDYLQKAQEKSHQWVRPTAPGNDRDNDRRRNNRPRERQPAPLKEHISMIFGGPEGGDSAAQRKNWVRSIYVGEVSAEPPKRKHTRREPIVFTDRDLPPTGEDHNDPLVITMDINGVDVARVLVDTGFTGDTVEAEGSIVLPVELGSGEKTVWKKMRFIVVDIKCVHNAILGRPGINKVGAVISMPHLCMKFHTPGGVGEVKGDQRNARECYARAVKKMTRGVNVISQEITKGETREKLEPEAETVEIELHPAAGLIGRTYPRRASWVDRIHSAKPTETQARTWHAGYYTGLAQYNRKNIKTQKRGPEEGMPARGLDLEEGSNCTYTGP
ncbi:unnamed protein product [Cuscuta campestris]|uniref:Uncharacterized protein n=1 Tax=Cuscuta campestris TaxID=132261 RepID=A0A484MCV4_9ASTE|nr:unnamed protein product [Cuscuta campestris]